MNSIRSSAFHCAPLRIRRQIVPHTRAPLPPPSACSSDVPLYLNLYHQHHSPFIPAPHHYPTNCASTHFHYHYHHHTPQYHTTSIFPASHTNTTSSSPANKSSSSSAAETLTPEEKRQIEDFISKFTRNTLSNSNIISQYFTIRHARSSGAGGQNVNKVNTKVDMRFSIYTAYKWLPSYVVRQLEKQESKRINNAGEFIVTSERHRTQEQNYSDCLEKLYDMIHTAAYIPPEPSPEKKKRIELLQKQADERRKQEKKIAQQKREKRNHKLWR